MERVRRVVEVSNPFKTIQGFFFGVQGYVNAIVYLLLPVL